MNKRAHKKPVKKSIVFDDKKLSPKDSKILSLESKNSTLEKEYNEIFSALKMMLDLAQARGDTSETVKHANKIIARHGTIFWLIGWKEALKDLGLQMPRQAA